jgi:hypothetical protein
LKRRKPSGCSIRQIAPDLPSSDFVLSGYIKGKLADYQCNKRDSLKAAIAEISNQIKLDELRSDFLRKIKRFKWTIQNKREYSHR